MLNNIFKTIGLLLGACLVLVLYGIYTKMDIGRFQQNNPHNIILDTKTGIQYYWEQNKGYGFQDRNGKEVRIKNLPRD